MQFWKMNGAGNDFIIINNIEETLSQEIFGELAKLVCERHLSLGADGLMVVDKPQGNADYRMIFYNSDGSLGEMCGNGARCISRYGYEKGLAGEIQKIETTAGIVIGERLAKDMYKIRLNDPSTVILDYPVNLDGEIVNCSYVELGMPGIPHAVVPIKDLKTYPADELIKIGRKLRFHSAFPKGANVNFYEIIGHDHVYERTYERGVEDFTYACGTGTGSTVTVLTELGLVSGNHVRVDMKGGTLYIDVIKNGEIFQDLYLTGPTNIVAIGELTDSNLDLLLGGVTNE
ncbi:diaminopimelate epimerase [Hornefia butyriciproducens]|uniref:diaminopimelate epimerase n=1 Tax=Hornefia butyriciproducens TaxID=2652293 RepID=UPI002A90AE02|nr:diaminopimelate epimerase [Hornefia butyriciproducens]MDY5423450.1 diaminopimelate epimerase [Hornefia butyriciproducens]